MCTDTHIRNDSGPFPETARWCMSALKNLTRPGALAPSRPGGNDDGDDAAAIASRAILDAGMLPLLVGILLHKPGEGGEGGTPHDWQPNTLQDSALYTLLHMSALPGIRGALVTEEMNCAEVLSGICGACGRHEAGKGPGDLDQMRLQHLKAVSYFVVISFSFDSRKRACLTRRSCPRFSRPELQRLALSYLLDSLDTDDRQSSNLITDREAGSLVDLLSDTLAGRARDGPGGYSAATFGAKGVLYAVRCLLTEPRNRVLFASSAHGMRLNALLVGAASRFAAGGSGVVDAEAAEHAVVSLYWMTIYTLDEVAIGFDTATDAGPFLPVTKGTYTSVPGASKADTVSAVAETLSRLAAADGVTAMTGQAAHQIMLRLDYLKYEEKPLAFFVSDPGDLNLVRVEGGHDGKTAGPTGKGAKPTFHIFDRVVTRSTKGSTMPNKVFSSGKWEAAASIHSASFAQT